MKKNSQISFRSALSVVGILFQIYGLIVLIVTGPGYFFNWFYFVAGLVLLLLSCFWNRFGKVMRIVFIVMMAMVFLLFVVLESVIISYSLRGCEDGADYVIVLGSQIREDGPSNDYKARLDSAYEYLMENKDTMVITTGGQGKNEPVSEAEGGAKYLIARGLDEKRIILEDRSINTVENLANAKKLIEGRGKDASEVQIVIVSADYHLYRASYLAKGMGFEDVSCKGGHGLLILLPQYYTREFFALIKEYLF